MSESKPSPPRPVEGVVFGRSAFKTVGFIVLNVLLFLFGLFLIWAKLTDQVLLPGENPKQVTWWGLLIGIGLVLGCPLMIGMLMRSLWVKRRLIIGPDRLQVVELLGGEDTVVLQIPFANIAEFKYEATDTERRVGIDPHHLDDPDTYARGEDFAVNEGVQGRHFCISGGYQGGPRAIGTALEQASEKWAFLSRSNKPGPQ
jgi:hypothetical protein